MLKEIEKKKVKNQWTEEKIFEIGTLVGNWKDITENRNNE